MNSDDILNPSNLNSVHSFFLYSACKDSKTFLSHELAAVGIRESEVVACCCVAIAFVDFLRNGGLEELRRVSFLVKKSALLRKSAIESEDNC